MFTLALKKRKKHTHAHTFGTFLQLPYTGTYKSVRLCQECYVAGVSATVLRATTRKGVTRNTLRPGTYEACSTQLLYQVYGKLGWYYGRP